MKIDVEEIQSRVVKYIQGKHGKIGVILPQNDPNPEDLTEIYRTIAEIIVKNGRVKPNGKLGRF